VKDELLRNLGEEMGTRTGGASHVSILLRGLIEEAGLDVSAGAPPSAATANFIECLRMIVSDGTPYESAGALYALENSAVPELKIVAKLVNEFSIAALGRPIVERDFGSVEIPNDVPWNLNHFLAAHIMDFEVGHRDKLAVALAPYLATTKQRERFAAGFTSVLAAMEAWWNSMAAGGKSASESRLSVAHSKSGRRARAS
jgi:hypothetical protein